MPRIENIEQLRDQLLDAYDWVKTDPRRANQVKEMANAAGKVIASLKVELEYAALRGNKPLIQFLGGDKNAMEMIHQKIRGELKAANGDD